MVDTKLENGRAIWWICTAAALLVKVFSNEIDTLIRISPIY